LGFSVVPEALAGYGIALQQTGNRLDHVRDDVRDNLGKLLGW
jgi:hypothetical protein